jgi:F-type H+-transporting ATPase subunit a
VAKPAGGRGVRHEESDPGGEQAGAGTIPGFHRYALSLHLLIIIPGYNPPTGSLSTTAALALCVFIAVPLFGIARIGFRSYLKNYIRPNVFMLPFNIMSEVSRTLALAVRLFGNIMSGTMIVGILVAVTPLFFPILMNIFGLLTGLIQAYIFAILAMVYIASATRAHREKESEPEEQEDR